MTPPALRTPALVAIVVAGSEPAYTDVAMALGAELQDYALYDLGDRRRPPVSVLRAINDTGVDAVVAIGLRAATSSVAMADAPVVFSQVFNYREHKLVTPNSRGVAALPPPRAQLAAWRQQDPALERIGMIIGDGHEDFVREAEVAAAELGLELDVQKARSDQETIYLFRRMIRGIDGFWLLPDNRILSRRALDAMLSEAKQRDVPVAVPNDAMLEMGAAISMTSVAGDIAARILYVLQQFESGGVETVPELTPLTEIRVRTRDAASVAGR
jgi:ABC-type uncharacterized transport system substrate-binding protein